MMQPLSAPEYSFRRTFVVSVGKKLSNTLRAWERSAGPCAAKCRSIQALLPVLVQRVFVSIPLSPLVHALIFSSVNVRWPGDLTGSARADKNHTGRGSAKDFAERYSGRCCFI